jgi:Flp pilus assembly pilin Flp
MKNWFRRFIRRESGQDLVEYTLLVALVALACTGLFMGTGTNASSVWSSANSVLALANSPTTSPTSGGGGNGDGGGGGGDHGGQGDGGDGH